MRALLLLLCCVAALRPIANGEKARTLTIAAASDLIFCLEELCTDFKAKRPGLEVTMSSGASGSLAAQIARGAPFDVLMAADLEYPRQLIRAGHGGSDVAVYGIGSLVLWTTNPEIDVRSGLAVLRHSAFKRIAIANPAHAPYGRAAKAALLNGGVWTAVQSKIVLGENVAQAAHFVETGHVDAGIVAMSVLHRPNRHGRGTHFELPRSSYPRMEQSAVVTKRGAQNKDAHAFLEYLRTARARAILKRHGFDSPDP